MTHGFDTSFLVALEVAAHPDHAAVRAQFEKFRNNGDRFAIAPQVIAEFIHVVTDQKRFSHALTMQAALERSTALWDSPEVVQIVPDDASMRYFFDWMTQFKLGRKRVLDTMLAATYFRAGIVSIMTTNVRDFSIFGVFSPLHIP